jgi:hypothetical protein
LLARHADRSKCFSQTARLTPSDGEQRTHLDKRRLPAAVAPDDADAAVEIDAEVDLRKQWAGMMICDDDAD